MNCQVSIDFLTFTDKLIDNPREMISTYLGMSPDLFEDPGFGLLAYRRSLYFGGIYVLYDGDNGSDDTLNTMTGCCVSMSGDGCRSYDEFSNHACAWYDLFWMIRENDCNVSRIDVACDDFDGLLDMDLIISFTRRNDIRSRMMKRQIVESLNGKDHAGSTVYIGSPSSETRVRIYDKKAEQELSDIEHWVRCELVLRGQNALAFVSMACDHDIGELCSMVLNDKLAFIYRDDSNISRCSVAEWWSEFVGNIASVHLITSVKVKPNLERCAEWFRLQVAPSFAMLWDTFGMDLLSDILHDGRERLSDQQSALVEEFRKVQQERKKAV